MPLLANNVWVGSVNLIAWLMANASACGTGTMTAGSQTTISVPVTANTLVFFARCESAGSPIVNLFTPIYEDYSQRVVGTSFTASSYNNGLDACTFFWFLVEPA